MTGGTKVYGIDSVLEGYHDFDKLRNIYKELREILPEQPGLQSQEDLLVHGRVPHVDGNYGWELFQTNEGLVVLEHYGRWTGYGQESVRPPEPKDAWLQFLRVSLLPPQPNLQERIEKILVKYPKESKKKAEQGAV